MNRVAPLGVVALALAVGCPVSGAWADGPCANDIAPLRRQLAAMPGLGGPVSEPAAGVSVGAHPTADASSGSAGAPSDHAQPGGASLAAGGSPGTVGGAAGATGGARDGVSSGMVATSAEDVRRQSVGKPTVAQQAASVNAAAGDMNGEDRASQAKMALQRAVDLDAKGDRACSAAIDRVRDLIAKR